MDCRVPMRVIWPRFVAWPTRTPRCRSLASHAGSGSLDNGRPTKGPCFSALTVDHVVCFDMHNLGELTGGRKREAWNGARPKNTARTPSRAKPWTTSA